MKLYKLIKVGLFILFPIFSMAQVVPVGFLQKNVSSNFGDGKTASTAGSSAYQIKTDYASSTDGLYWIKNVNINNSTPFQIYADMTTSDGVFAGGWTLILCNSSYVGWNYTNTISRNTSSPSISSNYSIISWADNMKKSTTGFQYMIDANTRRSYGGIYTVNNNISFTSTSKVSTISSGAITRNVKFGTWNETDDGNYPGPRMPYYSIIDGNNNGFLTTDADNRGTWWGTLVTQASNWSTAPWISLSGAGPDYIWYWVR